VLALQPLQPSGLLLPHKVRLRLLGQVADVVGVPLAHLRFLAGGAQPLRGEFMDRLEHPESKVSIPGRLLAHQALVHKGEQPIEDIGGHTTAAHRLDRLQRPPTTEGRQASEQALLLWVQQIVRPLDRSPEGPLTLGDVTGTSAEQRQTLVQPMEQRLGSEHLHPPRRQLDGQGQPIDSSDDVRDVRRIFLTEPESRANRAGPLHEQHHGLARPKGVDVSCSFRAWEGQRLHVVLVFARQVERHPAGGQDPQAWRLVKEPADRGGRFDHLLEVVQHHKQIPVAEPVRQRVDEVRGRILPHAQSDGDL
jgi:hypothetical protein